MSKLRTGTLAITLAALAAGGVYWAHEARSVSSVSAVPRTVESSSVVRPPGAAVNPEKNASATTRASAAADSTAPLHPGEVLDFVADVASLTNVATLRLQVLEQRNFFGKNAWHLQALAHTQSPLRMVFELDDQFDSYSDISSFSTLQYEMHLNERGQKVESIQRMTNATAHSSRGASETNVPAGTRDPLALMEYLRTVDWARTAETRSPVYDGHKLYDVRASFQGKAPGVSVPAGNFPASKVEIRVFDGGAELKDAHFLLYLAENPSHTPVLLEAVMPFATARVALAKIR